MVYDFIAFYFLIYLLWFLNVFKWDLRNKKVLTPYAIQMIVYVGYSNTSKCRATLDNRYIQWSKFP